jgi:hypothetical protein
MTAATLRPDSLRFRYSDRDAPAPPLPGPALDVVDHCLKSAATVGPRKVGAFLPSMRTGAAGTSPVPGSEMPMSAGLDCWRALIHPGG